MRKTIGILAHVDAGKTTFSEQLLCAFGALRAPGRVDRGDTLLDHDPLERARGISIRCDQAYLTAGEDLVYWLDTPGHPDFAQEVRRALPAMDAAVLLISCPDGIQAHTVTLWRMLAEASLPVFLFLNKTDLPAADQGRALRQMRARLSPDCVPFPVLQETGALSPDEREELALRDDALLAAAEAGTATEEGFLSALRRLTAGRALFPVFSGAALRGEGVASFARALFSLVRTGYGARESLPFSALCYRVRREDGRRMTALKLLSGTLSPRDPVPGTEEKAAALFFCQGARRVPAARAVAGDLVLVPGLSGVRPGDRLGADAGTAAPPVSALACDVVWDGREACAQQVLSRLRELEEEDPALRVTAGKEGISLSVCGPLQLSVLEDAMLRRFGMRVSFGPARIRHRETVAAPAVGIGHYEPLRHYAEVHLRLVPAPAGNGIRFVSRLSVNVLPLHWQRLIETHVFEREWPGVLTGAPLADVTVELLAGRAHPKHTEGGDFREAVTRAMRCALMNARCLLLEPVCRYEIRVPAASAGAVSAALSALHAEQAPPEPEGEETLLAGEARLSRFLPWQEGFAAMTHGRGSLAFSAARWTPCEPEEQARLVAEADYRPQESDSPDSVFCQHGAGFVVPWNEVPRFAHCSHEEALRDE